MSFSYAAATALYEAAGSVRQRFGVRVAANTKLFRAENGSFVIKFYQTPIVVIMPDGYWVNSGRRRNAALLHRLTRFTPIVIRVADHQWWVHGTGGTYYPFRDKMILDRKGHPVYDEPPRQSADPEPAIANLVQQ